MKIMWKFSKTINYAKVVKKYQITATLTYKNVYILMPYIICKGTSNFTLTIF